MLIPRARTFVVGAIAAIAATACGDATGVAASASRNVSLSITTKPARNSGTSVMIAPDIIVGAGSSSNVRLTSAQLVLSHVELSKASPCASVDTASHEGEHEDDHCDEVHVAPVLLDLPMDTTVKSAIDVQIPPGTYTGLQAELHALSSERKGDSTFLAAHPDLKGISVRVTGTYTDAQGAAHPFTYTSAADADVEMAFATPVTVGAGTSNMTIGVDVASWFRNQDGSVIDPTVAANSSKIDHNIARSLRAFEDHDRDGHDDHDHQD